MFQLEKWRELQRATGKTAASSTATKSKLMERKGGQGSPRGRLPREVIEVGVDGDGNAAGEDTAVGVAGKNDNDQIENIRDKMIKDMQEEIRLEQFNQMQKMQLEARQLEMREAQLEETQAILARHWSSYAENARILQLQENWTRYMTCDGLPDPGSLSDLNTFLHVATEENENASLDAIVEKCQVITNLISKVERIVRSIDEAWKEYVREYESIAGELRGKLQWWIDLACYRLLRDIEANMNREDTKTSRYVRESNRMVCCVWAPIALPVGTKRLAEKERKPTEVAFEEIKLTIQFPGDVDCHRMAVRGLWLAYDHYSVETNSRRIPSLPKEFWDPWVKPADLLEFARTEYREKLRIWEEQTEERRLRLEEKKGILRKMENPPVFPDARKRGKRGKKSKRPRSAKANLSEFEQSLATFLPGDGELLPYLPTPNEIVRQREEEARKEVRRILSTRCEKTEVNLRKYTILGGVFRLDLIQQPPQPKDLGKDGSSTTLELPKEPRFARFCRSYEPPQPPPDSERTPEVIEAEMKALEVAMESLLLISLQLPDSVFWFEPPLVAHWIPERNVWSTKDVHDIKYNEEKQTIAFRSGKLGVHGLVANKFANLPFQSWELRPEPARNGRDYAGVVLNVTAATVQAEFIVRVRFFLLFAVTIESTPIPFPYRFASIAGGSSVSEFVDRRLVDAAETDTRRVRRIGDSDRANATNRVRPVSGTGRRQLPQGIADQAPGRGESFTAMHGSLVQQLRVLLVSMERDSDLLGDRATIQRTARLRGQRADESDGTRNTLANDARAMHRGQPRVHRFTIERGGGRQVVRRPVSAGDQHCRHQDPALDTTDLV
ncbi:dynein axonemal intermediate chain 7 isoform X3 [Nomia melanderi]|uniref:dynein axonemal intermediate chain 7 isoform X3 n=1 Tax=Nomia melanderi TaxID=2448451 RepID=UPI00130467C7|nr:protein CASC1-like isoform X3 [Nomia melanderi]